MDANGTRFKLILGEQDWARCAKPDNSPLFAEPADIEWSKQQNVLTLAARTPIFKAAPADRPPAIEDRRGAARDRFGNTFWIDETRRAILVNSSGTGRTSVFWPRPPQPKPRTAPGEFRLCEPVTPPAPMPLFAGLAITSGHYLVAGTLGPNGLVLFDLFAGNPPRWLRWPDAVAFTPFDMSPTDDGGVLILDREARRAWRLDHRFHVVAPPEPADPEPETFQPLDPGGPKPNAGPAGHPITDASAIPLTAADPIAIQALEAARFLVLDRAPVNSKVWLYDDRDPLGLPASLGVIAHDFAVAEDRLMAISADGNQAFAYTLSTAGDQLVLDAGTQFFPMRLFGGRAMIAADGSFYYDSQQRWVPLLAQTRPRFETTGTLHSEPLDSRIPDCVWHRVFVDACIPAGATVNIRSRAASREEDLEVQSWSNEPDLHRRANGSELPYIPVAASSGYGTWELLIQNAKARFLQLEITLSGNGTSTPRLRAVRVYYGRFSYLEHYLPAVYREDAASASFLDRYLANFEGFFTATEDRIASVQALLDPRSIPPEYLDWLASFFDTVLDPSWDEARRRLFLQHAVEFYAWRGTRRGVEMALALALDPCIDESIFSGTRRASPFGIRIMEDFLGRPPLPAGSAKDLGRWIPSDGKADLQTRYRGALGLPASVQFPLSAPGGSQGDAWRAFCRSVLGFVPGFIGANLPKWRAFLENRYDNIAAYRAAWQQSWTKFADVPAPTQLPPDGTPLWDWYQFEGLVLAMTRVAHRFSVLVPVSNMAAFSEQKRRADLARRIVEMEKPAHTVFDITFYWALFRTGSARLGADTQLGSGSRVPEMLRPTVLDQSYTGEAYLASASLPTSEGRISLDAGCGCAAGSWSTT